MPDIAACSDSKCPSRKKCYRYVCARGMYQSFGDFGAERRKRKDKKKCDWFWEVWGDK